MRKALYREYPIGDITPLSAFEALQKDRSHLILLESAQKDPYVGRFSFIGWDPIATLRAYGDQIEISEERRKRNETGNILDHLRQLHQKYACQLTDAPLGCAGGCAGYFAYDAVRYFENIPDSHVEERDIPDALFQFYDYGITFDHRAEKILITKVTSEGDESELDTLYELISRETALPETKIEAQDVETDLSDADYCKAVERAKEYIRQGDAFQIVISRKFQTKYSARPFEIYKAMKIKTPSPYMVYIKEADFCIATASPERLVSVENGIAETIPLAGTRPRGKTPEEDQANKEELLADEKEVAEHMMLVDLGRNDLGRVCKPGSIKLERLKAVQPFSHVMHIASIVRGILDEKYDALDALKATFPAGTLSGAPKIRAMEIIDELETSRRGLYGGAICIWEHNGRFDSCIGIRMAVVKDGIASVRCGAGIVYDSVPQKEAEETRHKAKGVLLAIAHAKEGLK